MGRDTLAAGEIYRMEYVENLIAAFKIRSESGDWTAFMNDNPAWSSELYEAGILAEQGKNDG